MRRVALAFGGAALAVGCSTPGSIDEQRDPSTQESGSPTASTRPTFDPSFDPDAVIEKKKDQGRSGSSSSMSDRLDQPDGSPVLGADFSWPQCPPGLGIKLKKSLGAPKPLSKASFVVVGLTNGPGFFANPCLRSQVQLVRRRGALISAYAVASFPRPFEVDRFGAEGPFDADDRLGRLRNVGFAQAAFNIDSMDESALVTPVVWVDVEPVPDFAWSADPEANAAVVEGLVRGYRDAGYRVGFYSNQNLWASVVGDLSLGLPEWRPAGETSAEAALAKCGAADSFGGGEAVLVQWIEQARDQNLTCPGISMQLLDWFHRY